MSENFTSNISPPLNMQPTYNPYSQYSPHSQYPSNVVTQPVVKEANTTCPCAATGDRISSTSPHKTRKKGLRKSRGSVFICKAKGLLQTGPNSNIFFEYVVCVDGFQVIQHNVLERRRFHNCVGGDLVYLLVLLCRNSSVVLNLLPCQRR